MLLLMMMMMMMMMTTTTTTTTTTTRKMVAMLYYNLFQKCRQGIHYLISESTGSQLSFKLAAIGASLKFPSTTYCY